MTSPPRHVLHWRRDGAPQPPTALDKKDAAGGAVSDLPPLDEIRRRSIAWLRSPEFKTAYDQMHLERWAVILASIFKPFQGLAILKAGKSRGYVSASLWTQYQALAEGGGIILGHMVICNTALADNRNQRVPCLALGSFDPTARQTVAQLAERMGDLYTTIEDPKPGEEPLVKIVQDDEYQFAKRTLLPKECTGGAEIYAFNLMVCAEDLSPDSPDGSPCIILAQGGPRGVAVVVPWAAATGNPAPHPKAPVRPPPLPGA